MKSYKREKFKEVVEVLKPFIAMLVLFLMAVWTFNQIENVYQDWKKFELERTNWENLQHIKSR